MWWPHSAIIVEASNSCIEAKLLSCLLKLLPYLIRIIDCICIICIRMYNVHVHCVNVLIIMLDRVGKLEIQHVRAFNELGRKQNT